MTEAEERALGIRRGIGCMLASGIVLAVSDVVMKALTVTLPPPQLAASRAGIACVLIAGFLWFRRELPTLRVENWQGQSLRAALFGANTILLLLAFKYMPLADAMALQFANPLIITALAPWMLGERIGWRRWAAVAAGFAGVVLIVRPTGETRDLIALLPLGSAVCAALRDIVTRRICATESTSSLLLVGMVGVFLMGSTTAPFGWVVPDGRAVLWVTLGALLQSLGMLFGIRAFRWADASVVAPFRYCALIWVTILGFVVFGEIPATHVFAGIALVVAANLYIFHRETRGRRKG